MNEHICTSVPCSLGCLRGRTCPAKVHLSHHVCRTRALSQRAEHERIDSFFFFFSFLFSPNQSFSTALSCAQWSNIGIWEPCRQARVTGPVPVPRHLPTRVLRSWVVQTHEAAIRCEACSRREPRRCHCLDVARFLPSRPTTLSDHARLGPNRSCMLPATRPRERYTCKFLRDIADRRATNTSGNQLLVAAAPPHGPMHSCHRDKAASGPCEGPGA